MVGSYSSRKLSVTKRMVKALLPTPPPPSTTCGRRGEQGKFAREKRKKEKKKKEEHTNTRSVHELRFLKRSDFDFARCR